jgi:hypothetical protein
MPSEPLLIVLYDIRDNILYAQKLLSGVTNQDFKASRTPFYAATRALEIISEASRRLPESSLKGTRICHGAPSEIPAMPIGIGTTMWKSPACGIPCMCTFHPC